MPFKIEGSDLEARMIFQHSGIFNNNDLFAHQKDFLFSGDIGNGATFTCAGQSFTLIWPKTYIFVFDLYSHDVNAHHISNGQLVLLEFCSVKVRNLFIIKYFEKHSVNSISSQYDIQYMKIIESEANVQNI